MTGASATPTSAYGGAFAAFFDQYCTEWVAAVAPELAQRLTETEGCALLDLCCGTGVATEIFARAGWRVAGLDLSSAMLEIASARLRPRIDAGQVTLKQADARGFELAGGFDACVCLDGALNHLWTEAELRSCFVGVAGALRSGAMFVFDLFEPSHMRHWNAIALVDDPDAIVAKRGVWDVDAGIGMIRYSGALGAGSECLRVDQTLYSRTFATEDVLAALERAGLIAVPFRLPDHHLDCRSGACPSSSGPCRQFYGAIKP